MIQVGIFTGYFPYTLAEQAQKIRALGFNTVQLDLAFKDIDFSTPESITLEQLLSEFKRRNKQIAIVVDEHGGTSGLVTIANVVAELVGNIAELGRKVEPVRALPGGKLELPGTAQLDDLEHTLEIEFDVDKSQVTTIAGYLMAKLGRVPVTGDAWTHEPFKIHVVKVDGPRVQLVRIEPREPIVEPARSPPVRPA
jgi:CBS domain containing-hemolysin-like protein